jgi:hypothetical protein
MMNIGPHMYVLQTIYNGNNVIITTMLGLVNAYFTRFCLPNLFMEWTLQYIFSCNYYNYVLLDYGLGLGFAKHKLINKIFTNL